MDRLPIFPLNAVMYPGLRTPLLVFEDRYRALMRDLLAIEDAKDRVFGIVAIREGYEVGQHAVHSAHRVGTLVQLTEHERQPDGRFDIEVVGRQRFRVREFHHTDEYGTAAVDLLDDPVLPPQAPEVDVADETRRTRDLFEEYRGLLSSLRGGPVLDGDLPADPTYLSYALAATCLLTLAQRQALLEVPDAVSRLRQLRRWLREELRATRAIPSLPATEVARNRWSPN